MSQYLWRQVASHAKEYISYRCAALYMESADWIPVIHGIEGCHLVNSHRWHLEYPCYLIHYADASEAMLSLAKV